MSIQILVPPLSQTMDTLVLVEWLKQVGEPVTKGEALFRVETDKAVLEVESPGTGLLQSILVQPGDEIKINSLIGSIVARDDTPNRIFISPRARRLAGQRGLSLVDLQGLASGPQGMIVERDVQAYLEQGQDRQRATPVAKRMADYNGVPLTDLSPARPGAAITKADVAAKLQNREQLTPTRRTIAQRLVASQLAAAPVTYMREVDATRLVRLRERVLKELSGQVERPTYTDFLARILCLALPKHPDLNATFDGETLERFDAVHLALAVDTERGLIAPVIHGAQNMGVSELARARRELVDHALAGSTKLDELSGGTFTLSNLGALGVDHFTPILNPPQVAVLGVGRVRPAPAVHKGKLRIRQLLGLSLTCDHRVIDGAPAARFLQEIANLIENPDLIWL